MHISIIDDEKLLANKIAKKLQNNGYAVSAYYGYKDFMQHGNTHSQLYIIDISLNDGSGFDIVHWLRKSQKCVVPILIISWFGDSQNKVYGLNIWADDYLTKPLVPEELLARVKAILRRPGNLVSEALLQYKNVTLNPHSKETKIGSNLVFLTKNESLVLEFFISNVGKIISKEKLIENVWGCRQSESVTDNTINVTIAHIRQKLGENFMLKTMYNQGYILE